MSDQTTRWRDVFDMPKAPTQIDDPVKVKFEWIVSLSWGRSAVRQETAIGFYDAQQWETSKEIRESVIFMAARQLGIVDPERTPMTVIFMDFRPDRCASEI